MYLSKLSRNGRRVYFRQIRRSGETFYRWTNRAVNATRFEYAYEAVGMIRRIRFREGDGVGVVLG